MIRKHHGSPRFANIGHFDPDPEPNLIGRKQIWQGRFWENGASLFKGLPGL